MMLLMRSSFCWAVFWYLVLQVLIRVIFGNIEKAIDEEAEKAKEADKPAVYTPSIQERVRDAALNMTEELEDAYESFQKDPENFDPKAFKIVNLLRGKGVKAAHARIIKDFYANLFGG